MYTNRTLRLLGRLGITAVLASCILGSCATSKSPAPDTLSTSTTTDSAGTISDEAIGRSKGEMHLSHIAGFSGYGVSQNSPIQIGGGFGEGSTRTYQYLNALRGPHGEPITYRRVGTCCPFKSPNSPFGGEALLEVYQVTSPGLKESKRLYFNWYDEGEVFVPVGFSSARE
jgi:hypothetical protein